MSQETVLALIASFIAGIIGNLLVGALFYWRGGKQLRTEAEHLRCLVNILAHALAASGHLDDAVFDENGQLVSFRIRLSGNITLPGSQVHGTLTVTPPPPRKRRRAR